MEDVAGVQDTAVHVDLRGSKPVKGHAAFNRAAIYADKPKKQLGRSCQAITAGKPAAVPVTRRQSSDDTTADINQAAHPTAAQCSAAGVKTQEQLQVPHCTAQVQPPAHAMLPPKQQPQAEQQQPRRPGMQVLCLSGDVAGLVQLSSAPAASEAGTARQGSGTLAVRQGSDASLISPSYTGLGPSSPVPYRPKSFISNDGTTVALSSKQRRTLSIAIPHQDKEGIADTAGAVGDIMAALMAEAARSGLPTASTPWSAVGSQLASMFSPDASMLDSQALGIPRLTSLTAAGFDPLKAPGTAAGADEDTANLDPASVAGLPAAGSSTLPPVAESGIQGQAPAGFASSAGWKDVQPGQTVAKGLHRYNPQGLQHNVLQSPAGNPAGRKRSYSDIWQDGGRCAEICSAAQAAAVATLTSPGHGSDMTALHQWQHTIEAAEHQWGPSHPAVGRAWIELAKSWQAADKGSDGAKHATKKAFDMCQILLKETAMESQAQESIQYLLDKYHRKSVAAKQAAAATAAREAAALASATELCKASAAAAAATPLLVPYNPPAGAPGLLQHQHPMQHMQQCHPQIQQYLAHMQRQYPHMHQQQMQQYCVHMQQHMAQQQCQQPLPGWYAQKQQRHHHQIQQQQQAMPGPLPPGTTSFHRPAASPAASHMSAPEAAAGQQQQQQALPPPWPVQGQVGMPSSLAAGVGAVGAEHHAQRRTTPVLDLGSDTFA